MDLDPSWSLNRVRVVGLPDRVLPHDVDGKTAYELVSAWRLSQMIRERSKVLGLDASQSDHTLRLAFDSCFASRNASVHDAASGIARVFGRNLGYVLLTLKRGDPVNRAARPEWTDRHWQHWGGIESVWLGGGLASGRLGAELALQANRVLQKGGVADLVLRVSPYGAALPLVGAARYLPPDIDAAVILDFGSTMIKRAVVTLAHGRLVCLRRLSSRKAVGASVNALDETTPQAAENLISGMASIAAECWSRGQMEVLPVAQTIPICIAAYVRDGNPMPTQAGVYMKSNLVTQNLEDALGQMVSDRLGEPIRVKLLHDGTAAAATYAGEPRCAVITIGTALGTGFPGDERELRPLADEFEFC